MSQQSGSQAARRSSLAAQAVLRKQRADRERRLEGLAVNVLTALGERDRAVRDAERRAGEALLVMTHDEGLSVREAVESCGSGRHTAGSHPAAPPAGPALGWWYNVNASQRVQPPYRGTDLLAPAVGGGSRAYRSEARVAQRRHICQSRLPALREDAGAAGE